MSNKELWNNFLENIKNEITNVSFETWFNEDDTKFYSFENGVVTIVVKEDFIRKHLESNYLDIITEGMYKVTNTNVTVNIVLESEIQMLREKEKLINNLVLKMMQNMLNSLRRMLI